jgi:hypothetical protein
MLFSTIRKMQDCVFSVIRLSCPHKNPIKKGLSMTMTLRDYLWTNKSLFKRSDFANTLDITPDYLSHICSGRYIPSRKLAKRIDKATKGAVPYSNYYVESGT